MANPTGINQYTKGGGNTKTVVRAARAGKITFLRHIKKQAIKFNPKPIAKSKSIFSGKHWERYLTS